MSPNLQNRKAFSQDFTKQTNLRDKLSIIITMIWINPGPPVMKEVLQCGVGLRCDGKPVRLCPNLYTNQGNIDVKWAVQLKQTESGNHNNS